MIQNKFPYSGPSAKLALLFGTVVLGAFSGCIGYVDGPRARVYAPEPVVYVQPETVVEDDYIYYPAYQVYYSSHRQQYIYLEGRTWVTRPSPPRVSVDVLLAAPSVRVGFHDSPAAHHEAIVRTYPRSWTPPGQSKEKHENHGNGNGHGHQDD